jgi:hypothetical protein
MQTFETCLKSPSSTDSFARENKLYQSGAIDDTFRQGSILTGQCEDYSAPIYQLRVTIDKSGKGI